MAGRKEMNWLQQIRQKNLEHFAALGFPCRKQEHWKYTDLTFLDKQAFSTPECPNSGDRSAALATTNRQIPSSYRIVFVNGFYCADLSSLVGLESEAQLFSILDDTQRGTIEYYLSQKSVCDNNPLIYWNVAEMLDGVFIRVPKNNRLSKPIHLLFLTSDKIDAKSLYAPRNIILLEENSQVVIFEEHVSTTSDDYFKNFVTQIDLKQGANLHYYKLQQEAKRAVHLASTHINQARDTQLRSFTISLGAQLARDDFSVALNEAGATCDAYGLYVTKEKQHVDHHTRIDHYAGHTKSEECYKGILSHQSTAVYNGKVIVHPQAQKINSKQTNKNLLLSNAAEVNTKPELEIYADDVQCAHGATVAQVDPESLFYLRSRGLSEAMATNLLVQAFADEILTLIPDTEIRNYVRTSIYNAD